MQYVGVDLAWATRNPTGVAVLDETGALCHASAVRTDEEIVATVRAAVPGDCLVGIDAPLIVENAKGSRPAERALGKDYEPAQQVAVRGELRGPGGVAGGIDVHGDGAAQAYTGRFRRRSIAPADGEDAWRALRRALTA